MAKKADKPAKLTGREIARLLEIDTAIRAHKLMPTRAGVAKTTTAKLIDSGHVIELGGKIAKTGRRVWYGVCELTDLGREALAAMSKASKA